MFTIAPNSQTTVVWYSHFCRLHFDILSNFNRPQGSHYSLDWTTGLDYWTGLLNSPRMV